jgi:two-component system chemotaxis sensor kinase CheA
MKTRLQPLSSLWDKLPRLVRDISFSTGKPVSFKAIGGHTELDKTILEAIKDPLTHLIRNAVDHGIESTEVRRKLGKPEEGRLCLRAFPDGGYVIIELQDDGTGLNTQKISQQAIARGLLTPKQAANMSDSQIHRFIFAPGFSTADKVTSISGRGVGMDVVRTNIESISGQIQIASESGRGTTMRLKIPLSLSIIPTLLVSCSEELFAIPETAVTELVRISEDQHASSIVRAGSSAFLRLRNEMLPLLSLSDYLQLHSEKLVPHDYIVVVLSVEGCRFGVIVDSVHDIEEIVVKALDSRLQALMLYTGATILGDGRIVLIVDPSGMLHHLQLQRPDSIDTYTPPLVSHNTNVIEHDDSYLIVQTDSCSSTAIPVRNIKRIERLSTSLLERVGASDVIQYRDTVLPVIDQAGVRDVAGTHDCQMSVVVLCSDDGRELGLIVDSVIDISTRQAASTTLHAEETMAVSIVNKTSTLLLDVPALFEKAYGRARSATAAKYLEGRL